MLKTFAHRSSVAACLVVMVVTVGGQAPTPCTDSQECRALALQARDRGAYETFHDLAWRAVQSGRPNDPDLMYLLARAQALSGRRRDALIMLRRLAEAGAAGNAATEDDFRRVRELPGWGEVAALIEQRAVRTAASPAVAAPAPRAASPAPIPPAATAPSTGAAPPPASAAPAPEVTAAPPVARSPLRVDPASVAEAARFTTASFVPAGFAYDAVSRRFLFGDAAGRRLFVVGEGSDRPIDLARATNAGFDQVSGFAIDATRGTLWVASGDPQHQGAALHQLQLISGREVTSIPISPEGTNVRLTDVAVGADGSVFMVDDRAPRVLRVRASAKEVRTVMSLPVIPASMALTSGGRIAYVAHAGGLTRVDLQAKTTSELEAPAGITLAGFAWIRWHRNSLIGLQEQPDGSRAVMRLRLARSGQQVSEMVFMDASGRGELLPPAAVVGDDLYYPVMTPTAGTNASGAMTITVRRVRLPR